MSESIDNTDGARKLDDAELENVAGGNGAWSATMEQKYSEWYEEDKQAGKFTGGFEQWLADVKGVDQDVILARTYWTGHNSPSDKTALYLGDGKYMLV